MSWDELAAKEDLHRQEESERQGEHRREADRIGAGRCRLPGLDEHDGLSPEYTYRLSCAMCGVTLVTFDVPVLRSTLREKLCREHVAWKQRQLEYQKMLMKHPEWRETSD